jgi:hypothetical protein
VSASAFASRLSELTCGERRASTPAGRQDCALPVSRQGEPGHDRAGGAVADIKGLRLSGYIAWPIWLLVHLWYLVGFQNRLLVFIQRFSGFATHGRGARLITEPAASAAGGNQADR